MSSYQPRSTRRVRLLAGTGAVSLLFGLGSAVSPSQADTATPADLVTTATVLDGVGNPVSGQTDVPITANGPLTGLANGTTIRVTMTRAAGQFFGADARLCRPGANIANSAGFAPTQLGNCIATPFNAQSDDFVTKSAAPQNTTVTFDFRVGTGSQTVTYFGGATRVITCDETSPCELWFKQSMDTAIQPDSPAGQAYLHYNLVFGTGSATTTTTTAPTTTSTTPTSTTSTTLGGTTTTSAGATTTTSAGGATTTTSAGGATTTTSAGGATTTTSAGGATTTTSAGGTTTTKAGSTTTSTGAGGTTTSTVAGGTTTSTAAGPLTVSPSSVAPGGSINVASSGWRASTPVTVSFNPTLGTLTADASGRVNGSFTIPVGTSPGSHTITLSGTGAGGETRTLTAPFTVVASGALSRTGADVWRFSIISIAMILLGAGLLLLSAAQRRRLWTG